MKDVDDTLSDAADTFEQQLRNDLVDDLVAKARWLIRFHSWTPEQVKSLIDEATVRDVQDE